jgi:RHS repeat-associated protein
VYYNQDATNYRAAHTWYVRDASGNVMATYTSAGLMPKTSTRDTTSKVPLYLSELHMYGSSRLGIWSRNVNMDVLPTGGGTVALLGTAGIDTFNRGNKFFELANHLGNVLVTVSDRKIGQSPVNNLYTSFTADVVSATDYAPFGMQMVGRSFDAAGSTAYRYGFNGKENDPETSGDGNQYDYGFRIYNPRLGRFLSVDPLAKEYPWYTPYQFAGNKPIAFVDLDGREEDYYMPGTSPIPSEADPVIIWNSAVDGLGNILLRAYEWIVTDKQEGKFVRMGLNKANIQIPPNLTNKDLGSMFQVVKEDRTFLVRTDQSVFGDLKDVMIGALDVSSVIPSKGGGAWLAAKTSGVSTHSISEILKGLSINKRVENFRKAIDYGKDATGKTLLRESEAQTAGLLDQILGGVRSLKKGESAGDVIGLSGKFSGKSIDIMNPMDGIAKGKFKVDEFITSIGEHLRKSDFTAIDMRKMSSDQVQAIEKHIGTLTDAQRAQIITIK